MEEGSESSQKQQDEVEASVETAKGSDAVGTSLPPGDKSEAIVPGNESSKITSEVANNMSDDDNSEDEAHGLRVSNGGFASVTSARRKSPMESQRKRIVSQPWIVQKFSGDPRKSVKLFNLTRNVCARHILEILSHYASVESTVVIGPDVEPSHETGRFCAAAELTSEDSLEDVVEHLDHGQIDGLEIRVVPFTKEDHRVELLSPRMQRRFGGQSRRFTRGLLPHHTGSRRPPAPMEDVDLRYVLSSDITHTDKQFRRPQTRADERSRPKRLLDRPPMRSDSPDLRDQRRGPRDRYPVPPRAGNISYPSSPPMQRSFGPVYRGDSPNVRFSQRQRQRFSRSPRIRRRRSPPVDGRRSPPRRPRSRSVSSNLSRSPLRRHSARSVSSWSNRSRSLSRGHHYNRRMRNKQDVSYSPEVPRQPQKRRERSRSPFVRRGRSPSRSFERRRRDSIHYSSEKSSRDSSPGSFRRRRRTSNLSRKSYRSRSPSRDSRMSADASCVSNDDLKRSSGSKKGISELPENNKAIKILRPTTSDPSYSHSDDSLNQTQRRGLSFRRWSGVLSQRRRASSARRSSVGYLPTPRESLIDCSASSKAIARDNDGNYRSWTETVGIDSLWTKEPLELPQIPDLSHPPILTNDVQEDLGTTVIASLDAVNSSLQELSPLVSVADAPTASVKDPLIADKAAISLSTANDFRTVAATARQLSRPHSVSCNEFSVATAGKENKVDLSQKAEFPEQNCRSGGPCAFADKKEKLEILKPGLSPDVELPITLPLDASAEALQRSIRCSTAPTGSQRQSTPGRRLRASSGITLTPSVDQTPAASLNAPFEGYNGSRIGATTVPEATSPGKTSRYFLFPTVPPGPHGAILNVFEGLCSSNLHDVLLLRSGYYGLRLRNLNDSAWDTLYLGISRMKAVASFRLEDCPPDSPLLEAYNNEKATFNNIKTASLQRRKRCNSAQAGLSNCETTYTESDSKCLSPNGRRTSLSSFRGEEPSGLADLSPRLGIFTASNPCGSASRISLKHCRSEKAEVNNETLDMSPPRQPLAQTWTPASISTARLLHQIDENASTPETESLPDSSDEMKSLENGVLPASDCIKLLHSKGEVVCRAQQERIIYFAVNEPLKLLKLHAYASLTFGMRVNCSYDLIYCGAPRGNPPNRLVPFLRPARILTLDGGGVLGISSLKILERVELELQRKLNDPEARLIDCFDMIAGTSTGGIIALGLMTGVSIKEMITIWGTVSNKIFDGGRSLFSGIFFEGYDVVRLKSALSQSLGQRFLNTFQSPYCFVTSTDVKHNPYQLFLLRNYIHFNLANHEYRGGSAMPLWAAAWATAAAPTFLRGPNPEEFQKMGFTIDPEVQLCDGAMKANNPTMVALEEAARLAGKKLRPFIEGDLELLLSIGTGQPTLRQTTDRTGSVSTFQILLNSAHLLTSATTVHRDVLHWMGDHEDRYFRFNVPGIGDIALDAIDKNSFDIILKATNDYMTDEKYHDIKRLVDLLATSVKRR